MYLKGRLLLFSWKKQILDPFEVKYYLLNNDLSQKPKGIL